MTDDDVQLIKLLETRVRQLILRNKELVEQRDELQILADELTVKVESLGQENELLKTQYANLKTARMMQLSDNDTRNAKQRMAKLVRDIDKCIAILKAER